ncbi:hypothetical protein [Streptomyces sp. NBC_00987]|uniref:hypothetical protein n=1 Tax=Streptomyces sp. NBC_00987 TaxID=2903703 RepID=UPI00386BFD85|nr:hypothetical protein OG355_33410 [Streptomyces sp. NBC_00987]
MTAAPERVEFLYGIDASVSDDSRYYQPPRVVRFRITKKTPKRIYYVRRERTPGEQEIGYVNRQQLEADGEIYNHGAGGWWAPDFHLHLNPPVLEQARKPDLGELKAAMAAVHPDRGGTNEQFIAARTRYQRARTATPTP